MSFPDSANVFFSSDLDFGLFFDLVFFEPDCEVGDGTFDEFVPETQVQKILTYVLKIFNFHAVFGSTNLQIIQQPQSNALQRLPTIRKT